MSSNSAPTWHNATDGPLVIDDEGRMIGGHETMPAPRTGRVAAHVDAGRLVLVPASTRKATTAKTEEG